MVRFSEERVEKILYIFAIAIFMYTRCSASSKSCGEKFSTRLDQDVYSKHRLRSRVVESRPISTPFECYVKCMKNCRCLSYNVCNGGKLCELNSEKKDNNISLYETSDECDYHEYQFSKKVSRNNISLHWKHVLSVRYLTILNSAVSSVQHEITLR